MEAISSGNRHPCDVDRKWDPFCIESPCRKELELEVVLCKYKNISNLVSINIYI